MKKLTHALAAIISLCLLGLNVSYAEHHNEGHRHDQGGQDGHSHSSHAHDSQGKHGHSSTKAGPNGGRVITSVVPHLEFFVTEDFYVQISFLDDDYQVIAPADQVVFLIGGDRQSPTQLAFEKKGNQLVSTTALPEGHSLPIILSIKTDADAKTVREKFNLNLSLCPSCDYKEYACICSHGDNAHDAHNH